ncbi:phasin family protein [Paracoccus salsus]|uniref:phasin family protein n=1 Tax=Paracoccus salsus TaxID=2911061 RepID=UPI001F267A8E|nr:phasin family protein [Paracoccus salsus]MCF3975136.1 phasin family protein [Paracoccus salsus]
MAKPNTKAALDDIQSLFNPKGGQDVLKMWAGMTERMTANFVKAGTTSVEIMSNATKEALANLDAAAQVRDDVSGYAKAYGDLAQKQVELLKRTAQEVGELAQKAGTEAQELASDAGKELSSKVAADVQDASDKVASLGKEVAEKAGSAAKTAA